MKLDIFEHSDMTFLDELKPEGWGDIYTPHEYYLSRSFCRTAKIVSDGKPIAIGTTIKHKNTAWLAHIIVHRDYRGQGLGNKIVNGLLSELSDDKEVGTISLIATDLGFPLYLKNGFVVQTEYLFYESPDGQTGNLALSPLVVPFESPMENDILQLDEKVSGEDRSLYLRDKLSDAFVYVKNGVPQGYSLRDLGDGLTIAQNTEAGLELLKPILNRGGKIVIPRENLDAREFLAIHGYVQDKIARRMTYGPSFQWEPEHLYNRIGGKLG